MRRDQIRDPERDPAEDRIRKANLVSWLARPTGLSVQLLLSVEASNGGWHTPNWAIPNPLRPHVNDDAEVMSAEDLAEARRLNGLRTELDHSSPVWAATRALWRALTEPWWEQRYLTLWIALEALFGPDEPGETTYRIAHRLAFFLSNDRGHAGDLYEVAKDGYRWRSKIVHGLRHRALNHERSLELMRDAERLVRASLQRILSEADLLKTFASRTMRARFLDALPFQE